MTLAAALTAPLVFYIAAYAVLHRRRRNRIDRWLDDR